VRIFIRAIIRGGSRNPIEEGPASPWQETGGTAPGKMSTSSKSSASDYETIGRDDTDSDKSSDISPHGNDYDGGSSSEVAYDRARRRSFIEEDEDSLQLELPVEEKDKPVTWMSLPHKSQLAILTIARLSEPLVQTSLRVSILFREATMISY
jgi:hypothetical protein